MTLLSWHVEGVQFRGRAALDARVAHAYDEFVGSGKYHVSTADDVSRHGDVSTFTIQLSADDGEVAWSARVIIILGETGRISEDYHVTVKPLVA